MSKWHCRRCGAKIYGAPDPDNLCGWCRLTGGKGNVPERQR